MSDGVTRKDVLKAAGAVGVVGAGALGGAGVIALLSDEQTPADAVVARAVRGPLPLEDPLADAWTAATPVVARLLPQQLAPPYLGAAAVSEVEVRALTDGSDIGFRLEWEDGAVDDLDGVRRYHDAAAVMLPVAPGKEPPITMGSGATPVHILQWRATWQRDLATKTGVDQIYPRVVHDVMPDDVLPERTASLYWVGREAGNPLSQIERTTPVEQMVAEGFGTTTHLPGVDARGRGVHEDGRWRLAVGFPAAREGVGARLAPGQQWFVAFAVWLGDRENRGGRKHYTTWVPLSVEQA